MSIWQHLELGEIQARGNFFYLVEAGHETWDPRHLKLATDELQLRKAVQDATKDEVIGQLRAVVR